MIRELHKKMKSLDLEQLKEDAVLQSKDDIIRINQEQLRAGRSARDMIIRPSYTKQYLKLKQRMGSYHAPSGVPDLFLTGAFQGDMDVVVENGEYDIISWDDKNAYLQTMYDDLFGLTEKGRQEIMPIVTAKLMQLIKDKLN